MSRNGQERATKFVVLTTQRNGSTWLMSLLNGVDGISAYGELFLPRPRSPERRWDSDFSYPRYVESRTRVGSVRPVSVYRYLSTLYGLPGSVGFKLMYSQLKSFPEILPYLIRHRIPVVHLVRRNHLDVLVSFEIKRKIGKAHILVADDRPSDLQVELDTTSIERDLRRLQRKHDLGRKLLTVARLRHVEVAYEDLVSGRARLADVLDFLDLSGASTEPRSNIVKTRVGKQQHVIRNYDQVARTLQRSQFACLLD